MEDDKEEIELNLPDEIIDRLIKEAEKQNISIDQLVENILHRYIEKN